MRGLGPFFIFRTRVRTNNGGSSMDEVQKSASADEEHAGLEPGTKKPNATTRLVTTALHETKLVWDGEQAYAIIEDGNHRECWKLKSGGFRSWMKRRAYAAHGSIPNGSAVADAIDTLEGIAMVEGERATPAVRVSGTKDAIYIDLGDDDWNCIEVTKNGWRVTPHPENGPYLWRPKNLAPLPVPERGGTLDQLKNFLNLETEDDFRLVTGFILMTLRPQGPYPVLVFLGGQGSGKSYNSKVVKALTDPSRVSDEAASVTNLGKLPRDEDSLSVVAYHSRLVAIDNVSWLPEWMSDEFCRISSGELSEKRKLYTDFDSISISICRPVVLNGIVNFVTRGDLADRSVVIHVPTLAHRMREDAFWRRFEAEWPRLLGAVLDALVATMSVYDDVVVEETPRMADFAQVGKAAEVGLGWPEGSFLTAYLTNIRGMVADVLDNDVIAERLRKLLDEPFHKGRLNMSPGELLDLLTQCATNATTNRKDWPQSGKALANRLERLKPLLKQEGIVVERDPANKRRLSIRKLQESDAQPDWEELQRIAAGE